MFALVLTLLAAAPDGGSPPVLPELRRLAVKLEPQLETPWVKAWLRSVNSLKSVPSSTWHCSKDRQTCGREAGPEWVSREVNDEFVYARVTDPLGYARALEVLGKHGFFPKGKKVLDFGYGNLGQLLMLAKVGAQVHGVEVDRLLVDGTVNVAKSVTLHHGYFASDARLVKELGGGFDVWLSKNTLKRGYVHPDEGKAVIDLGLDDAKVLALIFSELKSGGFFFIYNLAPEQRVPYSTMADGRCPFSREVLEAAGFKVLAYDADDSEKARKMGHALEWDADGSNLSHTIFATYTLVQRP